MTKKEKIQEAKTLFGEEAVTTAIELVAMSDPDGAYTHLEDMGEFEAAEAVEFIYFEE
jgi:hypothetical protein